MKKSRAERLKNWTQVVGMFFPLFSAPISG
jgi:hypothetical protein